MTRITRNAAGSYTINVNGIVRGEIFKADGGWQASFCNEHGETAGAMWAPTKREIVTVCKNTDWNNV